MANREISFTFKMDAREIAVLDNMQAALGLRDRASCLRALIWQVGRNTDLLTAGDVVDLATEQPRGRKAHKKP